MRHLLDPVLAAAPWPAFETLPADLQAPLAALGAALPVEVSRPALMACCLCFRPPSPQGDRVGRLLGHLGRSAHTLATVSHLQRRHGFLEEGTANTLRAALARPDALEARLGPLLPSDRWRPVGGGLVQPREEATFRILGLLSLSQPFPALVADLAGAFDACLGSAWRKDPKTQLQESAAAAGLPAPTYALLAQEGPDHRPNFRVEVRLGAHRVEAQGASRKQAEKAAADGLLAALVKAGRLAPPRELAGSQPLRLPPVKDPRRIRAAEALLGGTFSDPRLVEAALAHPSLAPGRVSQATLASFGAWALEDHLLRAMVPHLAEDHDMFIRPKAAVMAAVHNGVLAQDPACAELGRLVWASPRTRLDAAARIQVGVEAFRALLGAAWLDAGHALDGFAARAEGLLAGRRALLEAYAESDRGRVDPKTLLQEVAVCAGRVAAYASRREGGPDHAPVFTGTASLTRAGRDPIAWAARASAVKAAEKTAARVLLAPLLDEAVPPGAEGPCRRLVEELLEGVAQVPFRWEALRTQRLLAARDLADPDPAIRLRGAESLLALASRLDLDPARLLAALATRGLEGGGALRRHLAAWSKGTDLASARWDEGGLLPDLGADPAFLSLQGLNSLLGKLASGRRQVVDGPRLMADLGRLRLGGLTLAADPAPPDLRWLEATGVVLELLAFVLEGVERSGAEACALAWEPSPSGGWTAVLRAPGLAAVPEAALWTGGAHQALLEACLPGARVTLAEDVWRLEAAQLPEALDVPAGFPLDQAHAVIRTVLAAPAIDPDQARLAAVTLHDYKNALLSMDTCLRAARAARTARYERLAEAERCQQQARALWEQFRETLGGAVDYRFEVQDLQGLLRTFLSRAHQLLPPGVAFASEGLGGACPVVCDGDLLLTVLDNLLKNAVSAMAGRGSVRLRWGLAPGGDAVRVELEDAGPGLPPAVSEALARRVAPASSTRPGRVGLGLLNAQRIARLHGGAFEITGGPGGTTAVLRLPLAAPGEGAA